MSKLTIARKSLEDQATDALREAILSGSFAPGQRLTEIGLSEQLGLSRGTVRGALQQLAHEELVVLYPYRGWAVQGLTAKDAWEVYTLRNALESLAVRIVAERMDAAAAAEIEAAYGALRKAVEDGARRRIVASDSALHRRIIALSGHSRVQAQYVVIEQQTRLFFAFAGAFLSVDDYLTTHDPMIHALLAGDADRAAAIAAEHNTADGQALVAKLKLLESEPE